MKSTFSKNYFSNIRLSNRLDQGQARQFVGPDLRPNCLQRLNYLQTILAGYIGTGEEFTNSCDECLNPYQGREKDKKKICYIYDLSMVHASGHMLL